jgi:hypothetical protein
MIQPIENTPCLLNISRANLIEPEKVRDYEAISDSVHVIREIATPACGALAMTRFRDSIYAATVDFSRNLISIVHS